ncbi:MAG: hypothetical protein QOD99_1191 [Chthoniobacter sp.]|nr:hypothetical protein [Chthoniobacter sp.]
MADPIPPTPAPEPKKRRSPGPLDSRLLEQLQKDEDIARAAVDEVNRDPALASALGPHFLDRDNTIAITAANLQELIQQAGDARAAGADATSGSADFHSVTGDESDETKKAIAAIRNVQTRAKAKYEESDPARLGAYYIGQPLRSRAQITQAGAAVYDLLRTKDAGGATITPQDTLPGFDQAKIDQLKTDLGSYSGIQTAQSGAQSDASGARQSFEEACAQVTRRRRKLQLAVDAERPFGPDNAALRRRLGMPVDKGMS